MVEGTQDSWLDIISTFFIIFQCVLRLLKVIRHRHNYCYIASNTAMKFFFIKEHLGDLSLSQFVDDD